MGSTVMEFQHQRPMVVKMLPYRTQWHRNLWSYIQDFQPFSIVIATKVKRDAEGDLKYRKPPEDKPALADS